MKRALILAAILAAIGGLAFLVARPSPDAPAATPYVGKRGGSRSTVSGLGVSLRRGAETRPVAPGTPVRAGDELRFTVRAESAVYLLVRLRDGAAPATTIFPPAGVAAAAIAHPGEALPVTPTVTSSPGKVVVSAVFADGPFSVEGAAPSDGQEIDLVIDKE